LNDNDEKKSIRKTTKKEKFDTIYSEMGGDNYDDYLTNPNSSKYKIALNLLKERTLNFIIFIAILIEIFLIQTIIFAFLRHGWIYVIIVTIVYFIVICVNVILVIGYYTIRYIYKRNKNVKRVLNKLLLFFRIPIPK